MIAFIELHTNPDEPFLINIADVRRFIKNENDESYECSGKEYPVAIIAKDRTIYIKETYEEVYELIGQWVPQYYD